jgi:hypothetical protein
MAVATISDCTILPGLFSSQLESNVPDMLFVMASATAVRLKDSTGGTTAPKEDGWRQ